MYKNQSQVKSKSVQDCTQHTQDSGLKSWALTLLAQAITVLLETNIAKGYIGCLAWE